MLFERLEDEGLAQHSYAVGCPAAGRLAVVDPRRDVDVYVDYARRREMAISHVLETHIHADYASGARELAQRTGAELHVSGHDAGERYEVAFPHRDLLDGDALQIGSVRLEALHTPGHTPEHLAFLVYDGARSEDVPELMLSGDFLFVGSLGRPDLLGEEAERGLAEEMWRSARERIADLPDGLEVHPAHGAGSMCGSGMGGRPTSTLGYERVANPYLDPGLDREAFVEKLLTEVPPFPDYYRRMKEVNSEGPALLGGLPGLDPLDVAAFAEAVDAGHLVVDLRGQRAFGRGHVPGALGIGSGPDLSEWAGWVVPYDRPLLLVPGRPDEVEDAVRALVRVGLDDVAGWLEGGMSAWRDAGRPVERLEQIAPDALQDRLEEGDAVRVLDVRTDEEWKAGHVRGAHHVPGGEVPERIEEIAALREGEPLAVMCASGYRSTVVASVLQRAGHRELLNVTGGMAAWERGGLATVSDERGGEAGASRPAERAVPGGAR